MDRIDHSPARGARRTIAVGIIRNRTLDTVRTEPGRAGTITIRRATPAAPAPAHPLTLEDLIDTVICPACHATAGVRCTTRTSKPAREPHGRRFEALEQAVGITQHRATVRSQTPEAWWSNGADRNAEEALLTAYAARALSRPAVTA